MEPERSTDIKGEGPKQAHDVMTAKVITVAPDVPTREIAQLLLDNGISAVPVVNSDGVPIGMVSEGDLIGRGERERLARRDWWLAIITGKQAVDDEFLTYLRATDRTARDVMSAPLVTVAEQTDVSEIARLLAIHHIKRVPVVRDGRIVGIVSRADLLQVVVAAHYSAAYPAKEAHGGSLLNLFGEHHRPAGEAVPVSTSHREKPKEARLAADDFRELVEDFHNGEVRHQDEARRAAARQRRQRAKELIDAHVFDEAWRDMLHRARVAAENGQKEYMLLRFPNELCVDSGRAINVGEDDWPATLRGEPAEIYLRWERDLKQSGFVLSAQVLEFPGGKPGDIGLFLVWRA